MKLGELLELINGNSNLTVTACDTYETIAIYNGRDSIPSVLNDYYIWGIAHHPDHIEIILDIEPLDELKNQMREKGFDVSEIDDLETLFYVRENIKEYHGIEF